MQKQTVVTEADSWKGDGPNDCITYLGNTAPALRSLTGSYLIALAGCKCLSPWQVSQPPSSKDWSHWRAGWLTALPPEWSHNHHQDGMDQSTLTVRVIKSSRPVRRVVSNILTIPTYCSEKRVSGFENVVKLIPVCSLKYVKKWFFMELLRLKWFTRSNIWNSLSTLLSKQ